jgi:hypothetical protein
MRSLICTPQQILYRWSNREDRDEQGMLQVQGRGDVYTGFWWGNLKERDQLEHPGIDGRIKLWWIFRTWGGGHGLDWSVSGLGQVVGTCKCGNEPLGSINSREFLELVSFSRRTLFNVVCKKFTHYFMFCCKIIWCVCVALITLLLPVSGKALSLHRHYSSHSLESA